MGQILSIFRIFNEHPQIGVQLGCDFYSLLQLSIVIRRIDRDQSSV